MKLSQKDKSLLLLLTTALIILWAVFSLISKVFFSTAYKVSDMSDFAEKTEKLQWFNVSKPLGDDELKDRVILLDFWSYSCVSCIASVSELKKMEELYGSKLTVIGVHNAQFESDKNAAAVRKAIVKYNIDYPVVNDPEGTIAKMFKVKQNPTFVLIDIRGNIQETFVGVNKLEDLKDEVNDLISKYKFQIERDQLPIVLEKNSILNNVLSFPSKIKYVKDFSYKSRQLSALLISDLGRNSIVISAIDGEIVEKIGGNSAGYQDGNFEQAMFSSPQGLAYSDGKIYVADTGNNAIREIDLEKGFVNTLEIDGDFELSLPSDVEFFPNKSFLVIANSGANQILSFDLKNKKTKLLAGSGIFGLEDGKAQEASLAETSALRAFGNKLYFLDGKSSSLRLYENDQVQTLIGTKAMKFGYKGGDKSNALMRKPTDLFVDDTGVYIVDSLNHRIRKYDTASGNLQDFVGGKIGSRVGSEGLEFDEPTGIAANIDYFYITDSNNNRVIALNRVSMSSAVVDVIPALKFSKEGFVEYLPNLEKSPDFEIKPNSELAVKIKLKNGWKMNEDAPSFINLLEMVKDKKANLVMNYDWNKVSQLSIDLPKLVESKEYVLQGVLYYCQNKPNALCFVKSYEQKLLPNSASAAKEVVIELGK